MRALTIGIMTGAVAAALACSKSTTGPAPSRNQPGTGTSTLKVTAVLDANDKAVPTGFQTSMSVSVLNGANQPVTGASVTIRNATYGTVTLIESSPGAYQATPDGFPGGDFQLDVVKGTDNVKGVIVGGPSTHTITAPVANSTVPKLQPLTVRWTVTKTTQAQGALVQTKDLLPVSVPDTGAYVIPGPNNPANPSQQIIVSRYNEVPVAGGLTGSYLRVSVRNTVEPVIVQ